MTRVNYREMQGPTGYLAHRKAFDGHSSMSAEWTTMRPRAGRLNDIEFDRLCMDWTRAVAASKRMYVVYSYVTPIAWAVDDEPAYVVGQRFSVTTSKGQSYVRAWINYYYEDTSKAEGFAAYQTARNEMGR